MSLNGVPKPIPVLGGINAPTPTNNSQIPSGSLRIRFNSDTIYQEIELNSTGQVFSPTRLPPFPPLHIPFGCQSQAQVLTCASGQQVVDWKVSFLGFH